MTKQDPTEHILALKPYWSRDRISDFEYIDTGYSNRNFFFTYDDEAFIFRMPETTQPFVDYKHEQIWFERLSVEKFVKPIAFNPNNGHMITKKIEGSLLADVFTESSDRSLLISYVAQLHETLPTCERNYPLEELLEIYGYLDGQCPKSLDDQTAVFTTCHNDLNPWNVIVTEARWETIDWEFVGNHDPLFDLITLHQGLNLPAEELFEMCPELDPISTRTRIEANIKNYWLREGGWAKYQIQQGNNREEIRTQLENAQAKVDAL